MTIDILNQLTPIPCTEREKLLKLRSLLIEIQAAWFGNSFGSGETFANPEIWEKMQEAVCLMQRQNDPSKKGIDLKAIASDYKLLEQIFIAKHWEVTSYLLDDVSFVGCDLVKAHHFSAIGILKEVHALHQSVLIARARKLSLEELKAKLIELIAANDLSEIRRLLNEREEDDAIKALLTQSSYVVEDSDRSIEQRTVDSYRDQGESNGQA